MQHANISPERKSTVSRKVRNQDFNIEPSAVQEQEIFQEFVSNSLEFEEAGSPGK